MDTTPETLLKAIHESAPVTIPCKRCGAQVITIDSPVLVKHGVLCDACNDAQIAAETIPILAAVEARRHERIRQWETVCPAAFLATEPHLLPRPSVLDKALQWRFGPQGLLLHGPTGTGKSRIAWAVAAREFKAGRFIVGLTSYDMGVTFPASYATSCAAAEAIARRWVEADILILDDVFKVKLTERIEEVLFSVIDRRYALARPIITTTNDTGASLAARMSEDRGEPLLRRLRENALVIAC